MKKFYIAVTVKQDRNDRVFTERPSEEYNPGYYAYVTSVSESDDLKSHLQTIGGLLHANICQTKRAAQELADFWNDCYKRNGTYFFGEATA